MNDDRHADLRMRLIAAAEAAIAADGLAALKARDVAKSAGCALGAIYNVFADMDALILAVNARALERLDAALAQGAIAPGEAASPKRAIARLRSLGLIYLHFAAANRHAWAALFEHRMAAEKPLPEQSLAQLTALFAHIEEPLSVLLPDFDADARKLLARTLFSAIHGIVQLGLEERFAAAPPKDLEAQISLFIEAAMAGLKRPGEAR